MVRGYHGMMQAMSARLAENDGNIARTIHTSVMMYILPMVNGNDTHLVNKCHNVKTPQMGTLPRLQKE